MSTNNKHKVSENELDNLLGQAFLNLDFNNPKNEELMETISNQILHTPNVGATFINKAFFAKLVSIIILIATSVFIYLNYFKNDITQPIKNTFATTSASNQEQTAEVAKQETVTVSTTNSSEVKQEIATPVSEKNLKQVPTINEPHKQQTSAAIYLADEKRQKVEDTSYIFPKLTEKEIKETKRQKEVMAMMLVKPKSWYPIIGDSKQNKFVYGKISDTTYMFHIARTEVTNLEYRTFLFDLLISGRKEEFIKAKPHQYLWLKAPGHAKAKDMKDNYFSDKKYNSYPVVNITPEGAELYCKWLSTIADISTGKIEVRLPYENEWIKAARHKGVTPVYPWPSDSIQNKVGCHLANFCIQKQSEKLRKSMRCVPKNKDAYASAEFMLGDSMMTAKVDSYNPNDNGAYCMVGNVAEIVYTNGTKIPITKGGSWNSDFEQCKLFNKEELNDVIKANPMTGFRPIFRVVPNWMFGSIEKEDPATGLSTLTSSEIVSATKEKKKMIDALVKSNKDKYVQIPMGSCTYKQETISVQSFYIETTEVTNLEYKTFLSDLLIQKRNDDYLLAKPNQQAWITKFPYSYNEPMTNMYFWHPAYDDYPVVNISRKGAQLYCEWLTTETNKILSESNKPLINDIRIPDEYEWTMAASNKKNYAKYANGNEFLRDSKGKYEMNYMCYSLEQCRYDTIMNLYIPKKEITGLKDKEENPGFVADGAFHTSYTKGYNPNAYGLYAMAGNASEMIINHKTKLPETKGGSWFSCDYYLQIDADDEYKNETKASPLIGFRPVFTAPKVGK